MSGLCNLTQWGFNPHLHVGGDMRQQLRRHYSNVSIHTSTWEVTTLEPIICLLCYVSIHTSTWEVTFIFY